MEWAFLKGPKPQAVSPRAFGEEPDTCATPEHFSARLFENFFGLLQIFSVDGQVARGIENQAKKRYPQDLFFTDRDSARRDHSGEKRDVEAMLVVGDYHER